MIGLHQHLPMELAQFSITPASTNGTRPKETYGTWKHNLIRTIVKVLWSG